MCMYMKTDLVVMDVFLPEHWCAPFAYHSCPCPESDWVAKVSHGRPLASVLFCAGIESKSAKDFTSSPLLSLWWDFQASLGVRIGVLVCQGPWGS